jgi:hypothetical protein
MKRCLLIEAVSSLVVGHVVAGSETLGTVLALERLFSSMRSLVHLQVPFFFKLFLTIITAEHSAVPLCLFLSFPFFELL